MEYRYLGKSGLKVSELCFGAMGFTGDEGWKVIAETDQNLADKLTAVAIENGINFFDTADMYSSGTSEIMLGKALQGKRQDVLIATKCGFKMSENVNDDGLSRKHVIEACEASLRRLQTDYIDLYQIHSYDFTTPIEETLSALNDLVRSGKVRYIGISNFTGWQLMKAIAICKERGYEIPISLQAYYSLLGRDLEMELIPVCEDQGLGIMPWSPLHGGLLTGKYMDKDSGPWPKGTRLKGPDDHLPYDVEQGHETLEAVRSIAKERQVSMSQVSLNYLLRKSSVSSIVIGFRDNDQLLDNLATVEWSLNEEEVLLLDELSEPYKPYPHWYFDIFRNERRYN
ncbi:MAG: aldo/keto reductase [Candidatus Marinimicrobia bacterium]|nr:aldo/keto reductase [Candidatus Neomarinimicrobiota bacterium]MCF7850939.1 aldo/keto reductase [Candidatus Neomarinimicrobiota bacterium]